MILSRIVWLTIVINLLSVCSLVQTDQIQRNLQIIRSSQLYAEGDSYSSAARKAAVVIKKRYFFPGHGARKSRDLLVEDSMESVAALDLPELDETDNIHSPEVSIIYVISNQVYIFIVSGTFAAQSSTLSGDLPIQAIMVSRQR